MPRAIPILIIVGLAIYSFFDVLQTSDERIRRYPKPFWLVMVLVPIVGAALWWIVGRPKAAGGYGPPRIINLNLKSAARPVAPDDDPNFIKRLDEEAWRRKREEQRRSEQDTDSPPPEPPSDPKGPRPNDGPTPGPGIAPAG